MKLFWKCCINQQTLQSGISVKHEDGSVKSYAYGCDYLEQLANTHTMAQQFYNGTLHNVLLPKVVANGYTGQGV